VYNNIELIMNFIIFALVTLLGACGLFWLEDKAKKDGDPMPQFIVGLGAVCVCFLAFVVSIII
jgi:hypothetical protein